MIELKTAEHTAASMDMLHGSLWNKLIRYALPVAATGILEQLFNASDIAIVGNFTGEAKTIAVAAVGANSPIVGLILNFFIGIALGANVVIANAIGKKDEDAIRKVVHTSVLMAVSGVLNVILNLFFVIVLKMTVNGVAIATVVANAVSSVLLLIKLIRTTDVIRINRRDLKFDGKAFFDIVRIGLPAGIQSAVFAVANIVIQSAINSLGTVVIAASSAAFNIEIIAYDVFNSFSQACTTFTGQNYGAGQYKRCRKVLILCIVEDAIATSAVILLILLSGKTLLALFNNDPQVIELGYTRLVMVFSAYAFSMLYENMSGYLRGFRISLIPAILTVIGVCGVRILWMFTVFPTHRTFRAILMAYPVSLSITALLILLALIACHPSHKMQKLKQ